MIANPERTALVSSLGWVDQDKLWLFDVPSGSAEHISLNSGAKYLSLHSSGSNYFSVGHHFDGARFELTVHSFSEPRKVLARATVKNDERKVIGDASIWKEVPLLYIEYFGFEPWKDFVLLKISPSTVQVEVQRLEWYDDTYDKGYQGVIGVLPLPGGVSALVSVQRSSKLVLHDLETGKKTGDVDLGGIGGNPHLQFRSGSDEIWASDYDSLVVLDKNDFHVVRKSRLQNAAPGTQQFIGDYSFSPNDNICVVARPFSGDVVGIESNTLKVVSSAKVGQQPLEVAALPGEEIVARDWKTGKLLRGGLKRS